MIIRTALFVGDVAEAHREAFDRSVRQDVIPLLRQLPGVVSAEVWKTGQQEDGLPGIYQSYQLRFDDLSGMEAMLQSDQRKAVHDAMACILPWFDGRIVHLVSHAD